MAIALHCRRRHRRLPAAWLVGVVLAWMLSACASLPHRDPLNVDVAGVESLPGEGMEIRLAVTLRIQNPNDDPVDFRGAALALSLNDRTLATGVSDSAGRVPAYGERLVTVPVTIPAIKAIQQLVGVARDPGPGPLRYRVDGKLEGGWFGTRRFSNEVELDLAETPHEPDGR
ncbi:LEA type 2 family protein [Marilutibacter spongiae]|uniref:LEA type 2 family protein n=1 Tax=Marilutibacter spongiae TaxID=2025720 RepID=A0A7W3TJQ0_9GAMM|nr:LEA type 2 family protein [Lysobacter spongiae]MBB1059496.1 LEA type 2 family protein [Lysobacter spongiae]